MWLFNFKKLSNILFIELILFLFFSTGQHCKASYQERERISSLDLYSINNIRLLNDILTTNDILTYFKIREKLISMPYQELTMLKKQVVKIGVSNGLSKLIDRILHKMENDNLYLLTEDIFVDNVPLSVDSPFYEGSTSGLKITDLKPHAEYLYFYNLKLEYRKNTLLKKAETYWINPKENIREEKIMPLKSEMMPFSYNLLSDKTRQIWFYKLKEDNLTDFFYRDLRQWMKRYEENAMFPVIYKGTVIMRNEHRLFCVELLSGRELCSVGNIDKNGQEFYQGFRHPHINSYGYELLLANDMIFTELSGKLVAFDLKDILSPELVWRRDLGEYTISTKPILVQDTLIVGLINARGELWFCGFNARNGSLIWNTYIGTSSYLSPVCAISVIKDDRVFIGTNHGVLVCLNIYSGNIIWINKFISKKYSLIEYWQKGYFKSIFSEAGSIKYDTQFIELGNDGLLYYKPRESDYFYIIDSDSGQCKEKILVDSDGYYILRANDNKAIFLKKTSTILENSELKVVELDSGKVTYNLVIKGGPLQGIHYISKNEMFFKIADTVHFLSIDQDRVIQRKVDVSASGWLLNSEEALLFIGEGRSLFCFDSFNQRYISSKINPILHEFLNQREKIKDTLLKAFQSDVENMQTSKMVQEIISNIHLFNLSFDQIYPVIMENIEKLKHPKWREFIGYIQKLYGDEVISYKDIEMKFCNFLCGAGLNQYSHKEDQLNSLDEKKYLNIQKGIHVRGEELFVLPIEIVKGPPLLHFFLLINRNQLLCVDEAGNILWSRNVFYRYLLDRHISANTDLFKWRMYTDDIKAYLYNNILIINDRVNIIALDVNNGDYIWSMANKGMTFIKERQHPVLNQDIIFRTYGIVRSFIKNIFLETEFIEDRLIITHGNKIYSLDPETGFCFHSYQLDCEFIRQMALSDGHIYLLTEKPDTLKVLNKELSILKESSLDFIPDTLKVLNKELSILKESTLDLIIEKALKNLFFTDNYIIIHVKLPTVSNLYIIDKNNHNLKYTINLLDNFSSQQDINNYLEVFKDKLLFINSFQKIIVYHFDNESVILNNIFNLESLDQNIMWGTTQKSKYYFIADGKILFPFRKEGKYFIASVDIETGRVLWERRIDGIDGFFYNLSDCKNINGTINFIISTTMLEGCGNMEGILKDIYCKSKLVSLDLQRGVIKKIVSLPSIQKADFRKIVLFETKNYFIYNLYGKLINAEKK